MQFKHNLFDVPDVAMPTQPVLDQSLETTNAAAPSLPDAPLFAEHLVLPEARVEVEQPVVEDAPTRDKTIAKQVTVKQLEALLHKLNQSMVSLQNQQVQQMQMQVRVQLFQFLVVAASARNQMQDMAEAWKSIGLLPMLTDDKRDYAQSAAQALYLLVAEKKKLESELAQAFGVVSQRQSMLETESVFPQGAIAKQSDAVASWSDWLFGQFSLRQVNQDIDVVMPKGDHVGANLSSLLLKSMQQLADEQWSMISHIDTLLYQLNQNGLESNISAEAIAQLQQSKQDWQAQAQAWMEQL